MITEVPPRQRAGTPLTLDASAKVTITFIDDRKGPTIHGTVDLNNRFYQAGGQFSDFWFRKLDLITMPHQVWVAIAHYADDIDYLEWYDREEDKAYQVNYLVAAQTGRSYNAGIGRRYGVPRKHFRVLDQRDF